MTSLCRQNEDCDPVNTNRLCYANLTRFPTVLVADEFGCACNSMFSWEGENCDEYSLSSYITMLVMGLLALASLYIAFMMFVLFVIAVKQSYQYEQSLFTTKNATILLCLFSSIGNFGWTFAMMLSTILISGKQIGPESYYLSFDSFVGRANFLSAFFGPVALVGALLALFNIILIFFDIADKTMNLSRKASATLHRNKRITQVFEAICILGGSTAVLWERSSPEGTHILGLVAVIPVCLVILALILGAIRLSKILSSSSATKYAKVITNIRNTTIKLTVATVIYATGLAVFSLLDTLFGGWKEFTVPGGFGMAKLTHHLQATGTLGLNIAIYQFIRSGK